MLDINGLLPLSQAEYNVELFLRYSSFIGGHTYYLLVLFLCFVGPENIILKLCPSPDCYGD